MVPQSVIDWYHQELDIRLTKVSGKLLDLKLVKTRLNFYKQLGFTSYEFGELISTTPEILDLEHGLAARDNLQYLLQLGINSFVLSSTLIQFPKLLTLSLEAHIKPRIEFYEQKLQLDVDGLQKIFEECPEFLKFSIVKEMRWRLAYFLRMGIPIEELKQNVILQCPQVLGSQFESSMKQKIEFLRSRLGTNVTAAVVCTFPNFMHLSLEHQLEPFLDYFQEELKMSRRLLSQMVKTNPHVLNVSIDREVRPKVKYLHDLGLDRLQVFKIVIHCPHLFRKSLKDGLLKKIEEFKGMGVPHETVVTLLVKSPNYFALYRLIYQHLCSSEFPCP